MPDSCQTFLHCSPTRLIHVRPSFAAAQHTWFISGLVYRVGPGINHQKSQMRQLLTTNSGALLVHCQGTCPWDHSWDGSGLPGCLCCGFIELGKPLCQGRSHFSFSYSKHLLAPLPGWSSAPHGKDFLLQVTTVGFHLWTGPHGLGRIGKEGCRYTLNWPSRFSSYQPLSKALLS